MKPRALPRFWRRFYLLPEDVQDAAKAAFEIWKTNPWHPSLHFKRVGNRNPVWSVRIDRTWRALAEREEDGTFVWYWIGRHDSYERMIDGSDD